VELSVTDGFILGINIPVRLSGNLEGTPGVHLIGPRGAVKLRQGCISAVRHIHTTPEDARALGVENGQKVYVRFIGPRSLIFDEVVVRVSDKFKTELHLDTDEGNAAGIRTGDRVEVIPSLCKDLCGQEDCPVAPATRDGQTRPYCDFTSTGLCIK
jgi:putative phosphotransacetylase